MQATRQPTLMATNWRGFLPCTLVRRGSAPSRTRQAMVDRSCRCAARWRPLGEEVEEEVGGDSVSESTPTSYLLPASPLTQSTGMEWLSTRCLIHSCLP